MARTPLASGRYTTERRIGHGGMATVYLARDEKLDREVAIKVLAENLADDPSARKRFMREARLAAKLSHPNVVQVFDVGDPDEERPFLVMEYVDGRALSDLLAKRRRIDFAKSAALLAEAAAGLAHAHEKGLVHRDVKPANLLVRRDGRLKIADFGIARALEDARFTDTGMVLGTRDYMAPEQADGGNITPATDVYSLGVVAREMVGGHKKTPPHLDGLIERCLSRDPKARPSAAALEVQFVSPATATTEPAAPTAPTAPATTKETERRPGLGDKATDVTERVFNAIRDPARRGRFRRPSQGLIAILIALILAGGVVFAVSSDSGDDPNVSNGASKAAGRDEPAAGVQGGEVVPRSDDPAEQARALSKWLRGQARD